MSGLVALVDLAGAPLAPGDLAPLVAAGAHRGPAGATSRRDGSVAFAHLALDATARDAQPYVTDDGLWVISDGRLGERRELARRLDVPKTDGVAPGDPELLAAGYRRWGIDLPRYLTGDFAFVLWDDREQRLLAARDRLGVKGLCWRARGERLELASEAQQLMGGAPRLSDLDPVAVADHLAGDCRDEERTFFRDVRRLRPAHLLIARADRPPVVRRYWDVDPEHRLDPSDEAAVAERFLELFQRAVKERLEDAGETIGVLLSGGLDSSSVAALAAAGSPSRRVVAVHCAVSHLSSCDETVHAEAVAEHAGLELVRVPMDRHPLAAEVGGEGPGLESPFMGWQGALRRGLGELSERRARILLTGHGGDGLLQGSRWTLLDQLRRGRLGALAELGQEARRSGYGHLRLGYRHLMKPWLPAPADALFGRLAGRPRRRGRAPWIHRRIERRSEPEPPARRFRQRVRQDLYENAVLLASVERAVRWQERVAAPFGIEPRHPLLDHRLVELVLAMPPQSHLRAGESKLVLRRAMEGLLPESVRRRRDKARFGELTAESLRSPAVAALFERPVAGRLGLVDGERLNAEYTMFRREGFSCLQESLWYALTLEVWLRRQFAGEIDSGSAPELGWRQPC